MHPNFSALLQAEAAMYGLYNRNSSSLQRLEPLRRQPASPPPSAALHCDEREPKEFALRCRVR